MPSALRLSSFTFVAALSVSAGAFADAHAQGTKKRGVVEVAPTHATGAPSPPPRSTRPATSSARIRPVSRTPLASLAARGANPSGPFARLSEHQRDAIIENSRSLLGVRYRWAGATPERGVDCSGLVKYVFAKLGIQLPHHAADLARLGASVGKDTAEMRVGDLLVFSKMQSKRISHVGIYVGDGMMVHASSKSKAVVETPIVPYRDKMNLRSVRRVFAVDSAAAIERLPQP